MTLATAHSVRMVGDGPTTVVIGHGIGGRQDHWQPIAEGLSDRCRVITFSVSGSPEADQELFSPARHARLTGYADDLRALVTELDIRGCVFVGHSMSAMAGALATVGDRELFSRMVLVNGSACYYNDPEHGYHGGFDAAQIDEMLHAMEVEYLAWSSGFGQFVTGNADRPEIGLEFARSLMTLNPDTAAIAFRAALTADYRPYLRRIEIPTLIMQSSDDPAVTADSARWMASQIPKAQFVLLRSTGHHPHLADPDELLSAMEAFIIEGT